MDSPSGISSARVADFVTPYTKTSTHCGWVVIAFALAVTIGVGAQAMAQDEVVPEPAVMARLASQTLVLDAVSVDGVLVAVGDRGHILISTDGGETWQQQKVPTRSALTSVYFHDRNLGWAAGHDSAIVRTADGGTNWELVNWAPEDEAPFFDIWFSDESHGIAIGAYGSYYTTSDGGVTWDFEPIGDLDWHLNQIAASSDGSLYMAGEAGIVFRSEDGGATWTELPSPYAGSFFGVLPLEDDVVLLFGLRGHLFRSEDAGQNWLSVETGTVAMLTNGTRLPDGKILITGLGGTLLVSEDGGRSFEVHQQSSRHGIQAAVLASDDSLLMVGEFGVRMLPISELGEEGGAAQ